MKIRGTKGLTFDDVLLVPKHSPITSRQDVKTDTWLTDTIRLQVPIVSANMDTVTETPMAIAMARAGGIGIIHRFMTIDQQAAQISRVKRAEAFMVEQPYAIDHTASIAEARRLMDLHEVGGLVVTNGGELLIGLLSRRDILLAADDQAPVSSVMTRPEQIISATPNTTSEEARDLLHKHRLEKLPVIDAEGRLVGLITAQDIVKHQLYPAATKDSKGRLRVGAAIGVKPNDLQRAKALLAAGADVLVVDIAHGHADHCINIVKDLRQNFPEAQIIAGNVASRDGARDLVLAGANAIKVGVGPGSICTTRIVTGFGVPQLTAIMDSVAGIVETGQNIPIIADGGIKVSGDMVKALAAGAAMGAAMGRKATEGSAEESAESQEDWEKVVPEGVEAVVPYRGRVDELIYQLVGGLRSGLSYGGARTIDELQQNAEFIEITPAGIRESHSHDVSKI